MFERKYQITKQSQGQKENVALSVMKKCSILSIFVIGTLSILRLISPNSDINWLIDSLNLYCM